MKTKTSTVLCGLISGLLTISANAAVIELGDLNFISDAGNASDGLAFLDMSYSNGLTSAAALTNAQATYADARLATPDEFDDLFAAAGILYDGSETASDAFSTGGTVVISSGANYTRDLQDALGVTNVAASVLIINTDPDGDGVGSSTRDQIRIRTAQADLLQTTVTPPTTGFGWLLVSDSAAIPEPGRALLSFLGLGAIVLRRRRS